MATAGPVLASAVGARPLTGHGVDQHLSPPCTRQYFSSGIPCLPTELQLKILQSILPAEYQGCVASRSFAEVRSHLEFCLGESTKSHDCNHRRVLAHFEPTRAPDSAPSSPYKYALMGRSCSPPAPDSPKSPAATSSSTGDTCPADDTATQHLFRASAVCRLWRELVGSSIVKRAAVVGGERESAHLLPRMHLEKLLLHVAPERELPLLRHLHTTLHRLDQLCIVRRPGGHRSRLGHFEFPAPWTVEHSAVLRACDRLTHLSVHGVESHNCWGFLASLSHLEDLQLRDCGIRADDSGLRHISALTALTALDLSQSPNINANALCFLPPTPIQCLRLRECHAVDAAALQVLQTREEYLRATCSACNRTGKGLYPGLKHLDLRGCRAVTSAALIAVGGLTDLRKLQLSMCAGVDGTCLAYFRSLKQLTQLDLSACGGMDGSALRHLQDLPQLSRLDLSCNGLGVDAQALAMLAALSALEHLDLSCLGGIATEDLGQLAGLRRLRLLDLRGCRRVDSAEAMVQLGQKSKHLSLLLTGLCVASSTSDGLVPEG